MKVLSLLLRNGCAVTHAAMLSGSLNESPELIAQEYDIAGEVKGSTSWEPQ